MAVVSMKQLLEAGVHFGHQTRRWNPKMEPYIYTERNGIYIIDLQKTVKKLDTAYNFVRSIAEDGGTVLFVGTKKQAQDAIREEAERCGMYYVNSRWLGGMLTNFKTMRGRVDRLNQLQKMQEDGTFDMLTKKEVIKLMNEMAKLERYLGGVVQMDQLPSALFVIDPRKERNAINEARKLHIPIVAVVDTNCDPDEIDYVIPGNDDAIRAIRLICSIMANAVEEGLQGRDAAEKEAAKEAEEKAAAEKAAKEQAEAEAAAAPVRKEYVLQEDDMGVVEVTEPATKPAQKEYVIPAEDNDTEKESAPAKKAAPRKKAAPKAKETAEASDKAEKTEKPAEEAGEKKSTAKKTTKSSTRSTAKKADKKDDEPASEEKGGKKAAEEVKETAEETKEAAEGAKEAVEEKAEASAE